jgi:hypothetical protein
MNHLFSLALLLLTLAPQDQKLPDAFYKIPEQERAKATLIVTGTYGQGRSPCIFMPDGSRVWALESWFTIKKVYRGQLSGKYIHINTAMSSKTGAPDLKLKVEHDYLVLLRPSEESMKIIKAGEHVPFWKAMHDDEIVAVVEME